VSTRDLASREPCDRTPLRLLIALLPVLFLGCAFDDTQLPRGYAIVYGVSDYAHISDLGQPDDDAEAVASMLTDAGYEIVNWEHAGNGNARINADATRVNLDRDFEAAASRIAAEGGPDTRFFFYFAGHGYGDGMDSQYSDPPFSQAFADYLAQEEATTSEPLGAGRSPEFLFLHGADPFNDVGGTTGEMISDDTLARFLAGTEGTPGIGSRQQVVVIDACHSGGFVGGGSSVDTVPGGYYGTYDGVSAFDLVNAVALYLDDGSTNTGDVAERSAFVISAAGEQDFSYEGSEFGLQNGVFTHYFLQSPGAADHNRDGYVTTTEAYYHAANAVAAHANPSLQERYGSQFQFMPRITGGAIDFVLFEAR
jgi:uncharacterized caspase-like protein